MWERWVKKNRGGIVRSRVASIVIRFVSIIFTRCILFKYIMYIIQMYIIIYSMYIQLFTGNPFVTLYSVKRNPSYQLNPSYPHREIFPKKYIESNHRIQIVLSIFPFIWTGKRTLSVCCSKSIGKWKIQSDFGLI